MQLVGLINIAMQPFLCILLTLSICNASLTQCPDEVLNSIGSQCGSIDIMSLYFTCKKFRQALNRRVYDMCFYDCNLVDGRSAPRLSLEKCYLLWKAGSDELEKSRLKHLLLKHEQVAPLWDCLSGSRAFFYSPWPITIGVITPFDSLVSWIKSLGPSIDRPILSLLLQHSQILQPSIYLAPMDELRILDAAMTSRLRFSVFKCLLSYLSPAAMVEKIITMKITSKSQKSRIEYAYRITVELLPRGHRNIYILGTALCFARYLGYSMQEFCQDINLKFDAETVKLKLLSKACEPYEQCVPGAVDGPDHFKAHPLNFDPHVLFTLLSTFPYSWAFTQNLLEFCIRTYDERAISTLLKASCTGTDVKITGEVISEMKRAQHSADLILHLTRRNINLNSQGCIAFFDGVFTDWEELRWSFETFLSILISSPDKTIFTRHMLSQLPKTLPEEYFIALGSFVPDTPQKIIVYMKHRVSAPPIKALLLLCRKAIGQGNFGKELVRFAVKYGYGDDVIALICNACN